MKMGFGGSDQELLARMAAREPRIISALSRRMTMLMLRLQEYVVREKLSGQVLHRRSGKLAGSVRALPAAIEGSQLVGRVLAGGGPAHYGKVHEFGGRTAYEILPVRKRALAFFPQGYANVEGGRQITRGIRSRNARRKGSAIEAFHRAGGVVVRSVQHPPLPARPFMLPSLGENREKIVSELNAAAREGMKEG